MSCMPISLVFALWQILLFDGPRHMNQARALADFAVYSVTDFCFDDWMNLNNGMFYLAGIQRSCRLVRRLGDY